MIINESAWEDCVKMNDDPYGKACVDIAREAMKILDDGKEFDPNKLIIEAEAKAGEKGITGFMAGCIAHMIAKFHSRGEEFKKKWNKEYGIEDENAKGVVNPAILTIKEK